MLLFSSQNYISIFMSAIKDDLIYVFFLGEIILSVHLYPHSEEPQYISKYKSAKEKRDGSLIHFSDTTAKHSIVLTRRASIETKVCLE